MSLTRGELAGQVECWHAAGWRSLEVRTLDEVDVAGIGRHPDTGRRIWWSETIMPATVGGGCACSGRDEGRHDLLCEHALRSAFGHVGNAPDDVKQLLRDENRLVSGTVVSSQVEAAGGGRRRDRGQVPVGQVVSASAAGAADAPTHAGCMQQTTDREPGQ